jgi:ABC-type sugar transport system substrate-binding protein
MTSRKKLVALVTTFVAAAGLLAGCGSSNNSGSSGSTSTSAASSSSSAPAASALQAKAQKIAASYMTDPTTFPGTSPKYNPGHGKVVVIACGFDVPTCAKTADWSVQAVKAMGWTSGPAEDGQTSVTVQANLVEQAAQEHVDGIILSGIDVNTIAAATEDAIKAGVRIDCYPCNSGAKWKGKVVDITPNWYKVGEAAAWEILARSGPHAKIWQVNDAEFSAVQLRSAGTEHIIKTECPTCSLTTQEVTATEMAAAGPPPWTAYLEAHPGNEITDAIGEYDGASIIMSNTDVSDGRSIPLGGYDGDPPNLNALETGKPPIAWTIGFPYAYEAWVAANVLGRWKAGLSLPPNLTDDKFVLITKANVKDYINGNPAGTNMTYPAPPNWQHAFEVSWGTAS